MSEALKLYARDGDDIQILSAHVQDAVGQIGDMAHLRDTRRFVILFNRYCWEAKTPLRVRSALQIGGVISIQQRKLNQQKSDGVISLLSVQFEPKQAPAGEIGLIFAGGGEIRLEVEACEAILEDISAPWAARAQPDHGDDET